MEVVVNLIGDTTTKTGLAIRAELDAEQLPDRPEGDGASRWRASRIKRDEVPRRVELHHPAEAVNGQSIVASCLTWHRGQVEGLVPVGSNPTRATDRDSSRRLAAKTPVLHTG